MAIRRGDDSGSELLCTRVAAGGDDRLWFRSATGMMLAGLGQAQPVVLFEPRQ